MPVPWMRPTAQQLWQQTSSCAGRSSAPALLLLRGACCAQAAQRRPPLQTQRAGLSVPTHSRQTASDAAGHATRVWGEDHASMGSLNIAVSWPRRVHRVWLHIRQRALAPTGVNRIEARCRCSTRASKSERARERERESARAHTRGSSAWWGVPNTTAMTTPVGSTPGSSPAFEYQARRAPIEHQQAHGLAVSQTKRRHGRLPCPRRTRVACARGMLACAHAMHAYLRRVRACVLVCMRSTVHGSRK